MSSKTSLCFDYFANDFIDKHICFIMNDINVSFYLHPFLTKTAAALLKVLHAFALNFASFPQKLVLIPKYTELPGFHGNEAEAEQRRQEMTGYMCVDSFLMTPTPALAEVCSTLICSISSIIHDGALRKWPGRGGLLSWPPSSPWLLCVSSLPV